MIVTEMSTIMQQLLRLKNSGLQEGLNLWWCNQQLSSDHSHLEQVKCFCERGDDLCI